MSKDLLKEVADNADMIIANYAFTVAKNGEVKVLLLDDSSKACVLDKDGNMLMSSMDDVQVALVQAYYLKNKELMGIA